ncbi:MAG TPA: alkaline phosphatase family protein [Tepidisphaeraceae bacterium]|nr:alkaline phosphatase family protein [Tepidisphaeraceae bacterium]
MRTPLLALAFLLSLPTLAAPPARNVILVTLDGVRWQEVFGGYDPLLNTKEAGGVPSPATLDKLYKRPSAEEARSTLMPFLWEIVAKRGQLFGDRGLKNVAKVRNPLRFSYPGYAELVCGFVDPRIDSNKPTPNPNVTVLEWLNRRPGFEGKIAVYGAWDVIGPVVNPQRSGVHTTTGWNPITPPPGHDLSEKQRWINHLLATTTRQWAEEAPDALVAEAALEHLVRHKPRVLWLSLGEPDEWAHARRYDLYLQTTRRCDHAVRRLWETAQQMPEYANQTTLIITTDHGRGHTPADWTSHGAKVPGADGWWAAIMGPGIPAKGVRAEGEAWQSQIAATLAATLGEDWCKEEKRAADPLPTR